LYRTTLTLAESGDGDGGDGAGDGDATAPLAGGDAEEKFLTFDPAPSTRDVPRDDASIGAHLAAAANQARSIYFTLVPIRPRSRRELHSLRTFSSPGGRFSPPITPRFRSPTTTPFNSV
jgi:hypothetical protein